MRSIDLRVKGYMEKSTVVSRVATAQLDVLHLAPEMLSSISVAWDYRAFTDLHLRPFKRNNGLRAVA